MPTIKDIAREAGVSHGTVSNVLNKTGKVSIEKIRLVEAAAAKLGYVPNTQAQLLRQGGKKMIAIILPTLEVARYRDLYDSLRRFMVTAEYEVGLYITEDICAYEEKILEQLPVSRLDAIITISCLAAPEKAYRQSCPIVYVDRLPQSPGINSACITFDFKKAGKELAAAFDDNCKKLAFFSNSSRFSDDSRLYEGALEQLAKKVELKKFSCDGSLIINKAFEILSEDDFDGIIATTLNRGEALITACQYSRKKAPLIFPMESLGTFPANTFPIYELNYGLMGKTIGEMLIAHLEKEEPLPEKTILKNDGFRFHFPFIKKAREKKTLSMLTLVSPATAALEKLLPDFEALTNIKMNLTTLSYEDLYEHIGLITKSDFYDLIRMDVAWLSPLAPDIYQPLNETGHDFSEIRKNLLPDSLPYYSGSGGHNYTLPFDPSYQVLLYRKDLFENATLKRAYYEKYHEHLTVPKDFQHYNRIAAFFTQSLNPLSPLKYGATLTYGSAATASCDYLPRLLCYNQDFIDSSGRLRIDTPAAYEALNNYLETYQYSSKTEIGWWFHSVKEFSDGQTAMTITFSNHASSIVNSKQSNVVGKAGTAIVPGGAPLLGGGVIGISKNSKKVNECNEFFKWFYSSEIASAFTLLGGLSPHMDIYKNSQLTNLFPWLEQSLESFQIGRRSIGKNAPDHYELKKFEYILGTAVKNAVNGTMDTKAALHYAQSLYDIQF